MTIICALAVIAATDAQNRKSPVVFDTYEWDFGTIEAANGTVSHTFTFTNNSHEPVAIASDIPSCKCVRAFYEDNEVAPGEKATVMVSFAPKEENGKSNRRVELLDKDGNTLASLSVKADV